MNGNIWLRGDQSAATPTDSNGAGGIILDTGLIGTGQLARTSIALRDTAALRNAADGTFKRMYLDNNNGVTEFRNQAFTQVLWSLDTLGNAINFGNISLGQNGAAFLPNAAGGNDLGSASLPLGNLWLGTAATNNFKFQPAATAAARIISIPDPLGNTSLPLTIASGTKALNTASITTATCDAGAAVAATGTLSTDTVDWSFNAAPTATNKYGAFLVVYAVPSTNTVTFYTCNPSATTSTPTAMTVNWSVRRP
jgi:hypothetical protein